MIKKIISLLLIVCLIAGLTRGLELQTNAAETYTSGAYTYVLDDNGNVRITKYNGSDSTVTIPNKIDGKKVIEIGNSAFRGCSSLTEITIPRGVETIGTWAFTGTGIKTVTIPRTVTRMAESEYHEGAFAGSSLTKVIFDEGMEAIPISAMKGCTTLKEAVLPSSINTIRIAAFSGCTSLGSITIPKQVKIIENGVFSDCSSLTEITIPEGVEAIGTWAFSGTGIKTVTIPRTVTRMAESEYHKGAFAESSLTKVIFEEGMEAIPISAMKGCTTLEEAVLPSSINTIRIAAFSGCTSLGSITIPKQVKIIENSAFNDCRSLTEVTIPSGVETIGTWAFSGTGIKTVTIPRTVTRMAESKYHKGAFEGSSLTKIIFEDGIKTIPESALNGCTTLEAAILPSSVTGIGDSAFKGCNSLQDIKLGNNITYFGSGIFSGCSSLVLYCNYQSNNVIYAVDKEMPFAPSDEKFIDSDDKMIDRGNSYFGVNMDSASAGSCLPLTINFAVKKKWKGKITNREIVTYIPRYTELLENSIRLDGNLTEDYSYNENSRRLTIPINKDSGQISYSVKITSKEKVVSYAYFEARKEDGYYTENIGAVNESFEGITLNAPDFTGSSEVEVSGIAPASTVVDLYVDDVKQDTVTSLKNGSWAGRVSINNPKNHFSYKVEVRCMDEDEAELSASTYVTYEEKSPVLADFKLEYMEHDMAKDCDLLNTNGVKPRIYYAPNVPFTFKAKFENRDSLDKVYITSTRNNEKKVMEAVYDPESGCYRASGFFDPDNKSYVPGTIGIEYTKKNEEVKASETFDMTPYTEILGDELEKAKVTYSVNTDQEVEAVIDLSEAVPGIGDSIIKSSIKYIDKTLDTDLDEIYDMYGITDTAVKYLIPGEKGESYLLNLDYSDPDNVAMVFYDTMDAGLTVASKIVSVNLDMADFGTDKYMNLYNLSNELGNFSKATSFAYKTYGIYSDYYDLVHEINQSSTIEDKYGARQKALELRNDQMAFLAMMTALPLIVGGSTMAAPVLAFSVLLGAMSAMSGIFYDARVAQIKGQKVKLNWVIDPSGYAYDVDTKQRIEGAKVTAYWIPYDESEDFWKNKPKDSEYGTLWDAGEYEQVNPMQTNVDGKYAWDVPEGWWRVKCEAEGYLTLWSKWMTVPPIQTSVNFAMISEGSPLACSHSYQKTVTPATMKKAGSIIETCSKCGTQKNKTAIPAIKAITLSKASYVYNGRMQKAAVTVKDNNGRTLKINKDYKVSYPKGMKNAGCYTVAVTFCGNYSGTAKKTFNIVPKGTSLSKVTAAKKGFTVKWKKQASQTSGYEIQYALKSNFKGAKTVSNIKSKVTSKKITKLKAKKKYYVRIRTYKTAKVCGKNKKLYSGWSKAKTVVTKK